MPHSLPKRYLLWNIQVSVLACVLIWLQCLWGNGLFGFCSGVTCPPKMCWAGGPRTHHFDIFPSCQGLRTFCLSIFELFMYGKNYLAITSCLFHGEHKVRSCSICMSDKTKSVRSNFPCAIVTRTSCFDLFTFVFVRAIVGRNVQRLKICVFCQLIFDFFLFWK